MTQIIRRAFTAGLPGVVALTFCITVPANLDAQAPKAPQTPQTPPKTPEVVPEPPPTAPPTNPPGTQTRKPEPPPEANPRLLAVIGCLEPAKAPPAEPTPSQVEDFILTHARLEAPAAEGAAAVASPSGTEARLTYRVTGLEPERLRPFLNQQVEIRGELDRGVASNELPGSVRTAVVPQTKPSRDAWPELKATSISMVSMTCSTGTR